MPNWLRYSLREILIDLEDRVDLLKHSIKLLRSSRIPNSERRIRLCDLLHRAVGMIPEDPCFATLLSAVESLGNGVTIIGGYVTEVVNGVDNRPRKVLRSQVGSGILREKPGAHLVIHFKVLGRSLNPRSFGRVCRECCEPRGISERK